MGRRVIRRDREEKHIKGTILDGDTVIAEDIGISLLITTDIHDTTTFDGPGETRGLRKIEGILKLPHDIGHSITLGQQLKLVSTDGKLRTILGEDRGTVLVKDIQGQSISFYLSRFHE